MGYDKCTKLSLRLIYLAALFAVIGIILKVMDYSTQNVADLLIARLSPDAFLRAANTSLFLSIALSLVRLGGKKEQIPDSE